MITIPALATLSIGQRIAGVAIILLIWLAPAFVVWLYMSGAASAQFDLGKSEAEATCANNQVVALDKAIKDAREEWEKTRKSMNDQAMKDAKSIVDSLAKSERAAAKITKEFNDYAKANPLPVGCRPDANRVRMFNRARRGDTP